jgi:hypothetical protein
VFTVGSGETFDLSTTLPDSIAHGGTFGIDASGSRLPAGMTLTADGILSVGSAAVSTVSGIVFTYDSP